MSSTSYHPLLVSLFLFAGLFLVWGVRQDFGVGVAHSGRNSVLAHGHPAVLFQVLIRIQGMGGWLPVMGGSSHSTCCHY